MARSTLRLLRQAWRMASPGLWKTYSVTLQKACRGLLDRCASGDLLGAQTALAGSYPRRAVYHEERSRIDAAVAALLLAIHRSPSSRKAGVALTQSRSYLFE